MALTEKQLRELPEKAADFWRKAQRYVVAAEDWAMIDAGSPEHGAWEGYFRDKGWDCFAMRQLREFKKTGFVGCKRVTMPAQWPEWFDKEWALTNQRGN